MKTMHKKEIAWSLWLPVIAVFVIISAVWFITIKLAHKHPTEVIEVPTRQSVD